jgi:hypothetical protein
MSMRKRRSLAAALFCSALFIFSAVAEAVDKPADHPWLLKADRVFDARSEQAHAGWVVLVEGDKIVAVGPAAQVSAPPGAHFSPSV